MPRRWTIEEENKRRQELVEFYVNRNKTIAEIGFGNPKHFKRAKEFGIIFEGA